MEQEFFVCVEITLPAEHGGQDELVETLLWQAGVQGIERHDDQTFSELVEDPRPRQPGTVRYRVHLDDENDLDALRSRFVEALSLAPLATVDVWRRDVTGHLSAWQEFFKPAQVSRRFWIHPPWERPAADGLLIEIDPGMAFGTGTHETTRLCLRFIDELETLPGARVFDVGTGSGILTIGALLADAASGFGIDFDPDAVREARRNAETNGVTERARFEVGTLDSAGDTYELVLANILPHVLLAMADALAGSVASEGTLILSGIPAGQHEELVAAFTDRGLSLTRHEVMNDWCALQFSAR